MYICIYVYMYICIYIPSEETRLQENHTLAASENLADGHSLRHEQRGGATKRKPICFFLRVDGLVVNFWVLTFSSIALVKNLGNLDGLNLGVSVFHGLTKKSLTKHTIW